MYDYVFIMYIVQDYVLPYIPYLNWANITKLKHTNRGKKNIMKRYRIKVGKLLCLWYLMTP